MRNNYAFKHRGICDPIDEPKPWPWNGDETRRVPVVDPNDNRVIRYVGYRRCISCTKHFWSEDVIRLRMCVRCKSWKSD